MDHAARGATALADGNFLAAVSAYTQALIEHPSSPDYFVQRSTALARLKPPHKPQHELSLMDAEYAVLLGQKRARREKIQAAQQRRVIALFGLGQFGNAAFVLGTMLRWRTTEKKDKMEGDMWKAKIQQKLDALVEGDPVRDVTVEEYPSRELPGEAAMKKTLKGQLDGDDQFKVAGKTEEMEEGAVNHRRTSVVTGEAAKSSDDLPTDGIKVEQETVISMTTVEPQATSSGVESRPANIRHEWIQNAQNVTITFYCKGVSKEQAEIEIKESSIWLSFPHPSNPSSSFTFSLDPLFAPVDPATSKSSILSTKVELVLRKTVASQKWTALEGPTRGYDKGGGPVGSSNTKSDDITRPVSTSAVADHTPSTTAPSYPTSSRSGPKNWDKVADDLTAKKRKGKGKGKAKDGETDGTKTRDSVGGTSRTQNGVKSKADDDDNNINNNNDDDEDEDEDEEEEDVDSDLGGDPVDGFFKKLYAGADPDTRRAMMKSYQESGGTALSTDWGDVGKRKVVPVESKSD